MEDYDYAKYNSCQKNPVPEAKQTSWSEFIDNNGSQKLLLDVRPGNHYNIVHFRNSVNIPFEELTKMPKQ
jgi:predicted sulfurtransferase